ncbi:hypothetical protein [Candidatus Berkiella aquae]|uniref:Uncharacterized protein n=1 Tax=Candidatus Berkiella aquae TaxID=295108 RepID=A0A0Q9YYU2_9GAMM|nr:hypothetical protein [Candidatus Berkiella aquae]MCS5710436.1 hypothetical protein [Candidatus Berkiella aquae]
MTNKPAQKLQTKEETKSEESLLNLYTRRAALPHFLGVTTQQLYTEELGSLDFMGAINRLVEEGKRIQDGNLVHVERMLLIQAQTLDAMFNNLACRATTTNFVEPMEALLRVALKAQSQCRATLETLANIKNPPHIAFVKQANIGHNQQVNNNVKPEPKPVSRAKKIKNQQNQLLEENHGKRLDISSKGKAIKANKKLASLGKINRTKNK